MTDQELLILAFNKAQRILAELELQAAGYTSLSIPAELKIQLEDQKKKVSDLEERLLKRRAEESINNSTNTSQIHDPFTKYYKQIMNSLNEGQLVFFLGNQFNLVDNDHPGVINNLSNDQKLALELVRHFNYNIEKAATLPQVAQLIAALEGSGPLYMELNRLLKADQEPTSLYKFLASLPPLIQQNGRTQSNPLLITTAYDDLLERAFEKAGLPFDLVAYTAEGEYRGKFRHWRPGDIEGRLIDRPNEYEGLSLEKRTVILKIHGAVKAADPRFNPYAITEDHHIDFMSRTKVSELMPTALLRVLRWSNILFLGYSLEEWYQRVVLRRIWGEEQGKHPSWVVQSEFDEKDTQLWREYHLKINLIESDVETFVSGFQRYWQEVEVIKA